jgi:SRSO17 transposase
LATARGRFRAEPRYPAVRTGRLLVRRSLADPFELAYFICHSPARAPLPVLVAVVGIRRTIEECFQAGKNEVGLDHYQVRLWHAWYRHITLAMLAHAWLAVTAAGSKPQAPPIRLRRPELSPPTSRSSP